MKHTTKRWMALLLAVVMLLGLLPATALAAGDTGTTIDVTEYGADPTGARESSTAVREALAAAKNLEGAVTISFPKGEYHFYADQSEVRELYVSNTVGTDQTYKDKRLGILVEGRNNVTIDGNDSQFIFHGDMTAFATIRANNVTFQNFSVDYASPSVIDVTVESLDTANKTATLYIPACYTWEIRNGNSIHWEVEGNSTHSGNNSLGYSQAFDTVDGTTARGRGNPFSGVTKLEKMDDTHVRATYSGALPVLDRCYQMRNTTRTTPGTFFWESDGVTLNNINIQFLHGFGMVGQLSKNITLDTVKFETRPGTGRTSAGFADFIQMSSIGGKVTIRNCDFSNPHDDPINIHGTFLRVTEVSNGGKTFKLHYQHSETAGFPQYHVGDEVEFAAEGSMAYVADSKREVVAVENPAEDATSDSDLRTITITLNEAVSGITANNYVVENVTYTPDVLIENCRFVETPTRGVLVTTRGEVIIRNNYFDRMGMAAIFISCDASYPGGWYESGRTQNVTIEKNVFHINSNHAIFVEPTGTGESGNRVHNNMKILNNTIYMWGNNQPFSIRSVDGLTIEGNKILRYTPNVSLTLPETASLTVGGSTSLSPNTEGATFGTQLYNLRACENVTIRNNIYDDGLNLGVALNEGTTASNVTVTGDALTVGGNKQLPAVGAVTYYSDNTAVATVDANGVVTGVSAGTANITAFRTVAGRTFESNTLTVTVTGSAVTTPPEKIEISGESMVDPDRTLNLTASEGDVAWAVKPLTQGAAATIDQTGVLTATAPGVVEVTASKGGVTASKLVTVNKTFDYLSDLEWTEATAGDNTWNGGKPAKDVSWESEKDGNPVRPIKLTGADGNEVTFTKGIGTHAESIITYDLTGKGYTRFTAKVGVSRYKSDSNQPHLHFTVKADGTEKFASGEMLGSTRYEEVDLNISGVNTLELKLTQPNNTWSAHGNWADAKLYSNNQAPSIDKSHNFGLFVPPDKSTVTILYDYLGDDGDRDGTLFAWYMADAKDGHYTRIEGANTDTLTVTAALSEKYVKAVVVPVNDRGCFGAPVSSAAVQAPEAPVERTDATLSSLSVEGFALTPAFDPNVTNYTVNVPAAVTSVTVNATATQATANVVGTGSSMPLDTVGETTFKVIVTAPDTTTKAYTITINRARSSNVTLENLTATAGSAAISYAAGTRFYGLVVADGAKNLDFSAALPAGAKVATRFNGVEKGAQADGSYPMELGLNHLELRVTAADGISTALYRVRVLKLSNATLGTLTVNGADVMGAMTDGRTLAQLDGSTATIVATPSDPDATVTVTVNGAVVGSGEAVTLTDEITTASIQVVAADGTTRRVYSLDLIKKTPNSAKLYRLDLGKVALKESFDPDVTEYTAVNYGNLSTTLNAMAAQTGAKITYETVGDYAVTQANTISETLNFYKGDGLVDESDGKTYNTVKVTVTSEDGTATETYTVKVEMVEEVYLSDLDWEASSYSGWGSIQKDLEVSGGTQKMQLLGQNGAVTFDKGLGTHANSEIFYDLSDKGFTTFTAKVGMDYSQNKDNQRLRFDVLTDGVNQYTQTDMGRNTPYKTASVTIPANTDKLTLKVSYKADVGDGNAHADWADAKLSTTLPDVANQKDILIKHLELEENAYTVYANTNPSEGKSHTVKISPVVKPVGAALSGRQSVLTWTSADPAIATAGQDEQLHQGTVTGVKAGTTTVTVANPNKDLSVTFDVTVKWELQGAPAVNGDKAIGSTLTAALNQLDQDAKDNVDIQWWRKGANESEFTQVTEGLSADKKGCTVAVEAANVGAQYKVSVTGKTNSLFEGTKTSEAVTMTKAVGDDMQADPQSEPATGENATDGKITGLNAERKYLYRKQNADGSWPETWTEVAQGSTEIINCGPGNYEVCRWFDSTTHTPGRIGNVTVGDSSITTYAVNRPADDGNGNYVRAMPRPAAEGKTVTVTVTTAAGWKLTGLTATNETTQEEFTPTKTEGKDNEYTFEMPASAVTLNPVFAKKTYTITHELTNITCSLGDEESHTATHGEKFTITLTPASGFAMTPTTITVTNVDEGEPFSDYTYLRDPSDPAKRVLTFEHGVTCNIAIVGTPIPKTYAVDYSGVTGGLRAPNAPQNATYETDFVVTLVAANGYALPETVTVTVGGEAYEDFTYVNGKITIPGSDVTGSIAIEAEGVAKDLPLQTVTMVGPARVGRTLTVNIVPVNAQVTYQWYYYTEGEEPTPIENATAARYDISAGDEGKSICVKVKAVEGSGYTGELTSEPTAAILGEAESFVFVERVTLDETATVEVGKTKKLTATVTPENPTSGVLFWSSDNEAVATVDQNGVVKGVAEGTATITAAATDQLDAASATCTVTVTKATSPSRPSTGGNSGSTTTTETKEDGTKVTTETKPDGTKVETTESPDGTKEVVETKKDGTVTETTETPDGTKAVVETKPDGSKTQTVEQADGTKSEMEVTKDGDVTITVTDESGEELVKTEIPATIPEPETKFEDVDTTPWAEEAIHKVAGLELVNGTGGNKYSPVAPMTRGSLATVLHRLSQGKTDYENTFKDVARGKYYTEGVTWAAKAKVVTGYSADIFAPDDVITREQLAVMLARYAKLVGLNTKADAKTLESFTDGEKTGAWAVDGVAWCVENGILKGKGRNDLDPTANVTRAEVAVMLDRFIALLK